MGRMRKSGIGFCSRAPENAEKELTSSVEYCVFWRLRAGTSEMSAGEDDLPRQRVQGGEDATLKGKAVALNHFDKFLSSAKWVSR